MGTKVESLRKDLKSKGNKEKAKIFRRFFKTGEGEYGFGDDFYGVTVPEQRATLKKYLDLSLDEIQELLDSKIHEERLTSLLILVEQFNKSKDEVRRKEIYEFYLKNAKKVNNWDLVDSSADDIVGGFLFGKDTALLKKLAKSENLWERRISIIATQFFIRNNKFEDTFTVAEILMNDSEDLIHKAVGWMIREVGKRSLAAELGFLNKWHKTMPRTMLRYAIEKFPEDLRQAYLAGTPSGKMEHE